MRFAQELREEAFAPREFIRGKDATSLARDLLALSQEEFSRQCKGSPMKRAKLRGLRRNAAVVLRHMGNRDNGSVLEAALDDPEPLVHEHAAWALDRVRCREH
ncbi:MAG: hypothetical protein ACYC1S_12730 [Gemmatimonadaceae bacterium]